MHLQLMACLFDGLVQCQANAEKHVNLQGHIALFSSVQAGPFLAEACLDA